METPTHAPGTPIWVEVTVDSLEAHASWRAFLSALFGWDWDEGGAEMGHYATARRAGRAVLGLGVAEGSRGRVTTYFATGDTDASVAAALALGATVAMPVTDVMDLGRMALLQDPTGAPFGLWQAGAFTGFGVVNEENAPGWYDHHSDDPAAAAAFYTALLGHGLADADIEGMRIIADGDRWFASFSSSMGPEQGPAAWNPIYVVDTLERAREVAVRQGGSVLVEEMPVPGSAICVVADPTYHVPLTLMRAGTPD